MEGQERKQIISVSIITYFRLIKTNTQIKTIKNDNNKYIKLKM